MSSRHSFRQFIYLFGLVLAIAANTLVASLEQPDREGEGVEIQTTIASSSSVDSGTSVETTEESSKSAGTYQWYKLGTVEYLSKEPVPVEHHFASVDRRLEHDVYWLFENDWQIRKKQEKLRHLSSSDEEYVTLKKDIAEVFQEQKRRTNCYYEHCRINIIDYVEPCHIPKDLAWRFGLLFALYGNFDKEITLTDLEPSLGSGFERGRSENAKLLEFYKTSLLFFSYYLGLSDRLPPALQHTNLHEIVSHSEFISALDDHFQKEFFLVDETVWIRAIQELDQQRLEHICVLFRCFYRLFLQNRESLPEFYVSLAAHLSNITTKIMLSAQKNPGLNLDAINPWMFKLYIDLKKWEALQKEDKTLMAPEFHTLLPILQERCLRFMPNAFTLEDVVEENEYAICKAVRKKNLLPTHQGNWDKGEEIIDEFEFSPSVMRKDFLHIADFFDNRARYIKGYRVAIYEKSEMVEGIYNYLSGFVEMSDVPITEDNALDYLLLIKLFDLMAEVWNSHYHVDYECNAGIHYGMRGFGQFYFPRTTYELRKKILKLCPQIKSYEALTVSLNPQKVRDEKEDITPGGWIDESETLRQMCVDDLLKKAQHLSYMMEQSPLKEIVVGTRGISGAGKSTFLKRNILPLIVPEGERTPEQIDKLAQGILNPDIIKAVLKKLQGDTLNTQIHTEGVNAFKQLFGEIADKTGYILDKRQLTPHDIMTTLVEPAKKGSRTVWLFDVDIPLASCISRILAREPRGEDSCPEYEVLIDGIKSIRRYRAQVVRLAISEDTISKYELYATSKQCLIAHKVSGELCPFGSESPHSLCIHNPHLFNECLKEPTDQEIEIELSQVIDDAFIADAIARGDIIPEQCGSLEKWRGMTLKKAIQLHVQGDKGSDDLSLFEPAMVFPFNGEEWLADLPQLIAYLQSEHLLHIRGVDETGGGLHWEAGQFEKGLNLKYQPEAKVPGYSQGGFQMKIGYFIIPMENLELHISENLSPGVARELGVRNENGELIGLRFFVHPAAYVHFAPLLRANIPFVPPSESGFMGTPTGSYNSWLIRCVSMSDRRPFIVKMGTPNGPGDIKNLFAGDDIVKTLKCQKRLDKLPDSPDFLLFKETAGLILKDIPGYPAGTLDSGIVICELPEELVTGECKILSLSAVMSCERIKPENRGIAALEGNHAEMHELPLIYELIEVAIQKGLCKTPAEFLQNYFIDAYLKSIEPLVFKEGYSIAAEGENLYLVLSPDNTIRGFAYRGVEGMVLKNNFLESYAWFYRYTNFIKLLNVLTQSESDKMLPPLGAPIRAGTEKLASERNLYRYLCTRVDKEAASSLKKLSITQEESLKLLKQLDASYLALVKRYFAIDEADIFNPDGTVPCAEKGSLTDKALRQKNQALWEKRISVDEMK